MRSTLIWRACMAFAAAAIGTSSGIAWAAAPFTQASADGPRARATAIGFPALVTVSDASAGPAGSSWAPLTVLGAPVLGAASATAVCVGAACAAVLPHQAGRGNASGSIAGASVAPNGTGIAVDLLHSDANTHSACGEGANSESSVAVITVYYAGVPTSVSVMRAAATDGMGSVCD